MKKVKSAMNKMIKKEQSISEELRQLQENIGSIEEEINELRSQEYVKGGIRPK